MGINDKRVAYLFEAVSAGTVRAAADKLGIAPSAVSRQIALLEDELATTLIERHRKGVKATQAGEILLQYFRHSRAQQEDCLTQIEALKGLSRGHVQLAVGEGFVSDLMSHALPDFQRHYPHISYAIRMGGSADVLRWIEEDDAHLGLLFHPPKHPKIRVQTAQKQPLCAVVSPSHELAQHAVVELHALLQYPMALLENHYGIRQLLAMVELAEHIRLSAHLVCNSIAVLKNYARSNMGITLLPAFVVAREIEDGQLLALPIQHPILSTGEVHLITRLGRVMAEAPLALLHHLKKHMQAFNSH